MSSGNSVQVLCPKDCGGYVPANEEGTAAYPQCYRCYNDDSSKEQDGFTPVPICAEPECNKRTRPFKNDSGRYTKRCDVCSGAFELARYTQKAVHAANYKGPVCRNGLCTSECAVYANDAKRYRKYCKPCGEERKTRWDEWKAFQARTTKVGAPRIDE